MFFKKKYSTALFKSDQITIKDIAKALGLSHSSVSRALKNSHQISEATIAKVKEYAALHNYKPNLIAQALKNKQSHCIGVVLSSIPNSFFAEVLGGIEAAAYSKDYMIIITQSNESIEKEIKNIENLTYRSVDGLLVSLSYETSDISHFKRLNDMGLPMVFFDRVTDQIETHQVVNDNAKGAYDATIHLIESGYKKIAQITSAPHTSITKERKAGYEKALADNNIAINENYIKYCMHGGMINDEVDNAVNELLSMKNPPDAMLLASDRITIRTLSFLRQKKIRIPEKIAVAGFSNFSSPELFSPSLTTVRQPAYEMGKTAAELLLKLIESKRPVKQFQKKVLSPELLIRDSSARKNIKAAK